MEFEINKKKIGLNHPTYFIADVAANHDGDLERAKELIHMAAEAGADAAKFQHFKADTIVSDFGFKNLGGQQSHQKSWSKSVYEVYKDASLNEDWTQTLKETCDDAGITFFTSPYSIELVDYVDPYVPAYKIGSGDITWLEIIEHMCSKNKPLLLAVGASTMSDVERAMEVILAQQKNVVLMQCNTNYTASLENFKFINLNVLKSFELMYPNVVLGLSDHTPGHATVLGAVTMGARVIEKHFTSDCSLDGPDHKFSMDPVTWRDMVDRTRELEQALGGSIKKIEDNESETSVLQRRAIRAKENLLAGDKITKNNTFPLRPCPEDALPPYMQEKITGMKVKNDIKKGDIIKWVDLMLE